MNQENCDIIIAGHYHGIFCSYSLMKAASTLNQKALKVDKRGLTIVGLIG